MNRMLSFAWLILACFCIGTVLALGGGFLWLWSQGSLDQQKVVRMVAVAKGLEPAVKTAAKDDEVAEKVEVKPTLDELAAARSLQLRDLELREQSLRQGLGQMNFERDQLSREKGRFEWVKTDFENKLEQKEKTLAGEGQENSRSLLENMKPKQAKEQILLMIRNNEMEQVVAHLAVMPAAKRAKIVAEFKDPEESKQLSEILRMMREGAPERDVLDETRNRLKAN